MTFPEAILLFGLSNSTLSVVVFWFLTQVISAVLLNALVVQVASTSRPVKVTVPPLAAFRNEEKNNVGTNKARMKALVFFMFIKYLQ
ncbi:hypothetical protein [Pantoea ananatis]|uniref:hypothetical protein n=1 Tax=Pantoea ananas TaxID=553 RepID=UPI0007DADEFF|nr:hypothetical protein [Pantoea ananatis]